MKSPLSLLVLIPLLGLLLPLSPGWAGDARHTTAFRTADRFRLDGVLSEDVWRENPAIGDFIQSEPHSGEAPTESTEVWLAYNEDALYIAIRCLDSSPEEILATEMSRDARLYHDDAIELLLDTFHDRRNAYYFATNPVGVLVDGRITENSYPDMNWDGIWNVKAQVDGGGWSAEIEIPFKTLAFNPNIDTWGFNISRNLARLREESRWASPSLDIRFTQVAMAGALEGLEELSQGVGLDVKPYALGGFNRDITRPARWQGLGDAGVDIFYRVTANLVSSTTFNTDFAETEVDTRQVNLTRFPLFFPERRAFFLEDAGVFQFGLTDGGGSRRRDGGDLIPFFSRRIGLVEEEEVPILFGEKLTGKVGRFDVGLMDVKTRDTETVPGRNFFVGRTKVNFWKQSYIGALVTDGEPTGETDNRLIGADLKLSTSNFLSRGKNFRVTLFGSKTSTPGVEGRDTAYGGEVSYPNDLLYARYNWQVIGENYNPALGFVRREGVRISSFSSSLSPRPHIGNIRQTRHQFFYTDYFSLTHKAVETRRISVTPLELEFDDGKRVEYRVSPMFERLFEPFEIREGILIPEGDYWFYNHRFSYNSPSNKPLFYDIDYRFGSFYTGSSDELTTRVVWRQNSQVSTTFELQQYWVQLEEGDFCTRLALFRFNYSFSPYLTVSNFVQYDTDSRDLGLQSRLRWIVRPGNELYLVVNHSWQYNTLDRFEALHTDVRAKLSYTFRF